MKGWGEGGRETTQSLMLSSHNNNKNQTTGSNQSTVCSSKAIEHGEPVKIEPKPVESWRTPTIPGWREPVSAHCTNRACNRTGAAVPAWNFTSRDVRGHRELFESDDWRFQPRERQGKGGRPDGSSPDQHTQSADRSPAPTKRCFAASSSWAKL